MKLYEIDQAIQDLVDPDTGEILDYEAFEKLKMARDDKIEGMALAAKNYTAEGEAIKKEVEALTARQKACEKNAARLKEYLIALLDGEKFKTARVAMHYGSSTVCQIADEKAFIRAMTESQNYEYLKFPPAEISKTAITNAIKAGKTVEGAELVKKPYIVIK